MILMKAAYWTAIGTMALPLGIIMLIQWPNLGLLATCIIVVGFVSFVAGWAYTIREEHHKHKEYELRYKQDELRIKREKASLKVLIFMADQLGVDVSDEVDMEDIE
ncbi:hypothetical protein ACFLX4_03755 [Chloroflexota bacterium]